MIPFLVAVYVAWGLFWVFGPYPFLIWIAKEDTDPEPAERVSSRIREVSDRMHQAAKIADSFVTTMTRIASARAREVKNLEAALAQIETQQPESEAAFATMEVPAAVLSQSAMVSSRIREVLNEMREAAKDADSLVTTMTRIASARARRVEKLEAALSQMETKNARLEAKFKTMAKVPPAAVDQFAVMLADSDLRSARRDLAFFVAGIVVTAVISLVITAAFRLA